jgi:leucyl aminopeptidase (aminopeptidase T)
MKYSKHDEVLIIFDKEKQDLANIFSQQVFAIEGNSYMLKLPTPTTGKFASWFVNFLSKMVETEFTIILLSESMYKTKGIMEVIHEGSLIRITTSLGTDVTLQARNWNISSTSVMGEVFTAPFEDSANGVAIFDSSVFWGKPTRPIMVTLKNGKIIEIKSIGGKSEQHQIFLTNSKKDNGASILAELGIGINPNADPYGHGMEAEQARGTCHLDFGNNIPFGGTNHSCTHYGGVIWKPTIRINERIIMVEGNLIIEKDIKSR